MDIKRHIRQVPDFPKPGILFYDISTLLAHPAAWKATVDGMATLISPWRPTVLAGIESRGFLIAAPLALAARVLTRFLTARHSLAHAPATGPGRSERSRRSRPRGRGVAGARIRVLPVVPE